MLKFIKILASSLMLTTAVAGFTTAGTVHPAEQKSEVKVIEEFKFGSNDGVYSLSTEQAAYLGAKDATSIGFFGISLNRELQKEFQGGAYFDAATFLNSVKEKKDTASIYAVLNGDNSLLGYTGTFLGALGKTTLTEITSEYTGSIAVLFGPGKVSLNNGVTFDSSRIIGAYGLVVPSTPASGAVTPAAVPLPTSVSILAAALAFLVTTGLVLRRRKHSV